jgi:hypothetical protein
MICEIIVFKEINLNFVIIRRAWRLQSKAGRAWLRVRVSVYADSIDRIGKVSRSQAHEAKRHVTRKC